MFPLRVRQAKYDKQFTGREPAELTERVKRASEEQSRSVNEVRVTLQEMGVAAYELLQKHAATLLADGTSMHADDLVAALMAEAIAAREKKRR